MVERRYDPAAIYGREPVGLLASRLSEASSAAALVARTPSAAPPFVFFDLETTGLAGGAGTRAFLVGCGRFEDDGAFVVRQFVLVRPADERRLLSAVAEELGRAGALVSFNGKSFDVPLLEMRYQFHRQPWTAAGVAHLDLLHPARRFWSGDEHSLTALECRLLGASRTDDVHGFEIPDRYFRFVRTGDARPLIAVLEHNRRDLLSLAALTARLLDLVRSGPNAASTAHEACGLGRLYADHGLPLESGEAYQRAVQLCEGSDRSIRIESLRSLAVQRRRTHQYGEAASYWRQLMDLPGCPQHVVREASEALAIHHEHRVRDLGTARAFALRSLVQERAVGANRWARSAEHRLARLERKLLRQVSEQKLEL